MWPPRLLVNVHYFVLKTFEYSRYLDQKIDQDLVSQRFVVNLQSSNVFTLLLLWQDFWITCKSAYLHDLISYAYVIKPFHLLSCHTHWMNNIGNIDPCFLWHQFYSIANWKKTVLDLDLAWYFRSNSLASYYFASKWVCILCIMYLLVLYTFPSSHFSQFTRFSIH